MTVDGYYTDHAASRAVIFELHATRDLRKQRVVLAATDIQSWTETAAALTHENRPASDDVAIKPLHAETLRVAVASVP